MEELLRAISEPTRRGIFSSFQIRPEANLTVDEVAAAHGIHRTVAFEHLELLARAGLLVRGSRPGSRGRPARTYRFGGTAVEVSQPPRQNLVLAILLADALGGWDGAGRAAARRAGEAYGRSIAVDGRSEAETIASLEPLGARYELTGDRIHAHNCVFREACESERQVICGVQAGILEGALAAAGTARGVVPEGPDGTGGCTFRIAELSGGWS